MRSVSLCLALAATLAIAGCRAGPRGVTMNEPLATTTPAPTTAPAAPLVEIVTLGQSVRGLPIEAHVFGRSGPVVMILGGIHGDEPTSVYVAERLIELLATDASLTADRTVVVLPRTNPDGVERGSRFNANRVDVNRNFPARNFAPSMRAGLRSGTAPASEPETIAMLRGLARFPPAALISIHSIRGARQQNNFDGPGEPLARAMAEHNGYPVTATIGYPTPGSLGSYAGGDLQIPMVTLELPRSDPGDVAWQTNRDALLAAIRLAR